MKTKIFILFCVLQSISGFHLSDNALASRIIGGEIAEDGIAPFQCSIQLTNSQVTKQHNCGCAIISKKYVLTAGHCTEGYDVKSLSILVGTNNLKSGGKYYDIEKVIEHEEYFKPPFANDIAVIKIQGSIEYNEKVQPIKLSTNDVPDGIELQLTGWGLTGSSIPDQLMIIRLKSITTKECRKIFGDTLHDGHMCTFTKEGEGACSADSGGPLVLKSGGKDEIVGIVNFGRPPCGGGYPDAYANVSYYLEWIKTHAEMD